jgi:hypothetical protein
LDTQRNDDKADDPEEARRLKEEQEKADEAKSKKLLERF